MKAADFVSAVQKQVGNGYWYGCYVSMIGTEVLLAYKAKQYPVQYTADYITRSRKWLGKPVTDCVGLVKGIVWQADFQGKYQAASDLSANGMYQKCPVKGAIGTIPEKPGLVVWKDGHIGVYVGNGVVVESRSVEWGVVRTSLKDRPWTNWGEFHLIDYSTAPVVDWQSRAIVSEAKVMELTARIEQEIPALQKQIAELEGDRVALKTALQKALA
jgi:hypothetical protein